MLLPCFYLVLHVFGQDSRVSQKMTLSHLTLDFQGQEPNIDHPSYMLVNNRYQ